MSVLCHHTVSSFCVQKESMLSEHLDTLSWKIDFTFFLKYMIVSFGVEMRFWASAPLPFPLSCCVAGMCLFCFFLKAKWLLSAAWSHCKCCGQNSTSLNTTHNSSTLSSNILPFKSRTTSLDGLCVFERDASSQKQPGWFDTSLQDFQTQMHRGPLWVLWVKGRKSDGRWKLTREISGVSQSERCSRWTAFFI